jgi:hypothetical protein
MPFLPGVRTWGWLMTARRSEAYNVKRQWCLGESRCNLFAAL